MPVSYPQHTSGFIPGFIPRFHTPSIPAVHTASIPLVSYPVSCRFHTPSIPCFIPRVDTAYHTCSSMLVSYPGFIPGFIPVDSYRFHGVHPRAAVSYP
eukprot:5147477-Heterocapsa_arctica.AAC.1